MKVGYEKVTKVTSINLSIQLNSNEEVEAFSYLLQAADAYIRRYNLDHYNRRQTVEMITELEKAIK